MKRKIPKCNRCQVLMEEGIALQNGVSGFPDFIGDTGKERGCTMSVDSLKVSLIPCWKCPKCGHSLTIFEHTCEKSPKQHCKGCTQDRILDDVLYQQMFTNPPKKPAKAPGALLNGYPTCCEAHHPIPCKCRH